MSLRVRQSVHALTAGGLQLLLGGVTTIVVSHTLGPGGRGACAVPVSIAMIATVAGHLSIEPAHTALWASARDRAAIAANALLLGLGTGTAAAIAAAAAVAALGPGIVPLPGGGLLIVALLTIPCAMTSAYLGNVAVLRGRVEPVNRGVVLAGAANAGSVVLLAAAGRLSVDSAVTVWALSAVVPAVAVACSVRPRLRERDPALARRAVSVGLRYHAGFVSLFLLQRLDVLVLNAMASPESVGLYAVAVALVDQTSVIANTISTVALSRQMEGDRPAAAAYTARIVRLSALLSLCAAGLVCAAAPALIPLVYGPAFAGSVGPLLCLAPGLWFLSVIRPIGAFLLRLDRPASVTSLSLAAVLVNVALNVALIPVWGVVGCALASTAAYGVLAAIQIAWFLRSSGLPVRRLVPGREELRYLRRARTGLMVPRPRR